jgi:copper chaperone NosL
MKKSPNLLMLAASLLLLILFVLPLWRITLEAPQYPEGMSMYIWINKITGDTDYTLQSINILNHYIGMKYIEPDSIPELKYFPMVVGLLALLGLISAWAKNKNLRLGWVVLLVLLSGLGVYDFYLWEYDYGHNLSPTAPIKVPGMVYQPPLFGSKMLLNFNAISYPHWGAFALFGSMILGFYSYWKERVASSTASLDIRPAIAALPLFMFFMGCSGGPQPIVYGQDACYFCKMTIVDARFGTEGVTDKGKQFKFDTIECLVNHLGETNSGVAYASYVTPFNLPNVLVSSDDCTYLINSEIQSPMGMYLTAYSDESIALDYQKLHGGEVLGWNGLLAYFEKTPAVN